MPTGPETSGFPPSWRLGRFWEAVCRLLHRQPDRITFTQPRRGLTVHRAEHHTLGSPSPQKDGAPGPTCVSDWCSSMEESGLRKHDGSGSLCCPKQHPKPSPPALSTPFTRIRSFSGLPAPTERWGTAHPALRFC
ncbi:uncharacterized protein O9250_012496 [Rhynochetos jubatus]